MGKYQYTDPEYKAAIYGAKNSTIYASFGLADESAL